LAAGDGHGPDGHGLAGNAFDRHTPERHGPEGADLDMAPGAYNEASAGSAPGAPDSEAPQADPHLDDILPAKSKNFFRLRR